jgi:hypothetical protein
MAKAHKKAALKVCQVRRKGRTVLKKGWKYSKRGGSCIKAKK